MSSMKVFSSRHFKKYFGFFLGSLSFFGCVWTISMIINGTINNNKTYLVEAENKLKILQSELQKAKKNQASFHENKNLFPQISSFNMPIQGFDTQNMSFVINSITLKDGMKVEMKHLNKKEKINTYNINIETFEGRQKDCINLFNRISKKLPGYVFPKKIHIAYDQDKQEFSCKLNMLWSQIFK